jgi:hypothetical protein
MIAAIDMGSKIGFVFSSQIRGDFRHQASESFSFCIENDPVALYLRAVYHLCHFHGSLTFKKI